MLLTPESIQILVEYLCQTLKRRFPVPGFIQTRQVSVAMLPSVSLLQLYK